MLTWSASFKNMLHTWGMRLKLSALGLGLGAAGFRNSRFGMQGLGHHVGVVRERKTNTTENSAVTDDTPKP